MMLEEFYSLNVADQQQYFGKTFFKVVQEGKAVWGWCQGFIHENVIKFQTEPGGILHSVNLGEYPPIFDFPDTGLYNLGNSTVYFHKVPKRQSKKGLCLETAQFRFFSGVIQDDKGKTLIPTRNPEAWRIRGIKEMFERPENHTLEGASVIFKKRKPISFALDRDFAISLGVKSKLLSLWYKQVLVGEIETPRKINAYPSYFQQEILDRFLPENVMISGVI